ncbi:alpha,alpha-trehalase TreA [[Pseudomonas] boreopolis]|uniref:Putative periplasmic trehalase n=1 Tax=Xanthomonas boreopolis TaxID=86183 RepID=A0A919FAF9_9XANT|nr:periplasmic trehalase [[Pseudomonas] boreopolis]
MSIPRVAHLRLLVVVLLVATACAPLQRGSAPPAPLPPQQAYPALFEAVQQAELFEDQKQFVDMVPRSEPARIEADYLARRGQPGFDLRAFVSARFDAPASHVSPALPTRASLRAHIDALWPLLVRDSRQVPAHGSELALPKPYVVPGGRFRELYYWDSYFTMLGLHESGQAQRSRDMLDDFAYLVDRYGHIPNGTRSYYLSRSQPPFFSHMVELEATAGGDGSLYVRYLPQLRAEYRYWMDGADGLAPGSAARHVVRLRDGSVLNRYWDASDTPRPESYLQDRQTAAQASGRPADEVYRELRAGAESGWDYSSRWLGDRRQLHTIRTTAIVPVDLNSLMQHLERTIAQACKQAADEACASEFAQRAETRRQAIERHLWNPAGYYADYDWQRGSVSEQLTAAAAFPLFVGIASPERAHATAAALRSQLLRPGGLVTTALDTGQQWDAPNVWAPLQWVAVAGLRRYDENDLARQLARNFLARVQAVYASDHKLVEKYNAEAGQGGGGEYPLQDGFGWTNGVTLKLLALYGEGADAAAR